MQIVDMEMHDIKLIGALEYMLQHQQMMCHLVYAVLVQPQGAPAGGYQSRGSHGVATGEKRDFMAQAGQLFC